MMSLQNTFDCKYADLTSTVQTVHLCSAANDCSGVMEFRLNDGLSPLRL